MVKKKDNTKWVWIILAVIVVAAIVYISIKPAPEAAEEAVADDTGGEEIVGLETDYQALEDACRDLGIVRRGCCIESAGVMKSGKYDLADEGVCPDGFEAKDLNCEGSYSWCVPLS